MLHTITAGITDINTVIEDIIKSHVDGVVIFNDKLVAGDMDALSKYNIPIVVIGNKINGKGISSVYVDIKKAVFELVSKFLEEGKDNIGILEDRKNPQQYEKMVAGAKKAYEARGKKFTGAISIPADARTSYAFLSKWMKDHRYDVVIANRDSQCFALLNASRENNISIPDEMEVVCVLDTKYNSMVRPQISSFSIPSYDLGAVSMRVMTKLLQNDEENHEEKGESIELSYLFTPRQTTKN